MKTKYKGGYSGVKLIWTVDWKRVEEFYKIYKPKTDLLFVSVNWNKKGVFAYIPFEVQLKIFNSLGREGYIKLPKKGRNPRGVEISPLALKECLKSPLTRKIEIDWKLPDFPFYNPYQRWVELWEKE